MTADGAAGRDLPLELAELCTSLAFREATIGMAALGEEFTILRVNAALARILGYEPEQMQQLPPERFTHPDDIRDFQERLSRARADGETTLQLRKRCLTQAGGSRLCEIRLTRLHKADDAVAGWLAVVDDVTDREQALDLLQRERRMFLSGPVVVMRWRNEPGWPVEYVSPNVMQEFGLDPAELVRKDFRYASLIHPEDLEPGGRELAGFLAAGLTNFEQTYRIRGRDGRWCWVRDFTVVHPGADGRVTHLDGYIFDDSARIVAERERAVREADLKRLLQFSRSTLAAKSFDQLAEFTLLELRERLGLTHVLLYLSETAQSPRARLLGGAGAEWQRIQERAASLSAADAPLLHRMAQAEEPLFLADAAGSAEAADLYPGLATRSLLAAPLFRAQDALGTLWCLTRGEEPRLELAPTDLAYFRTLAGIVSLASVRIRADQEWSHAQLRLRQAEKMEAIGQLAGGVAHNFNNALTVILGHASLLLDGAPAASAMRSSLEAILRAGDVSAKAVSQLLQFSRPQGSSRLEPVAPEVTLEEFAKMLRAVLDDSIRVVVQSEDDLPAIAIEGGALTMILMNLVLNARDAMPVGGRLTLRAGAEVRGGARWLRLEVEDEGIGMDAEVQSRVFEPYFTTKGERGTGLGLAAVYGAVARAGGTIEMRSQPGAGSCFTVRLPETQMVAEDAAAAGLAGSGGTRRVLVVEDEEAVRLLAARALRSHGYRVETAPNVRIALGLLARQRFDLVLADVVMHGMDGFELAQEVERMPEAPPVLLMSGYPGRAGGGAPPRAARGLLGKPFTAQQLLTAVEQALTSPASFSAGRGAQ